MTRTEKHFADIEAAIEAVQAFLNGKSRADYDRDLLLRSAVERQLEILGEAVRRLRDDAPALVAQIRSWKLIIGFRDALAHGYDRIDHDIVWEIVEHHLSTLAADVAMLKRSPSEG